ncbi:nuclear transport factor 2 family protein [Allorhizocola rhizosphaerae]|uniref:nuclear transport factor 2 family protein n=1 Tax=Allorhizocola rhizosphaerae TaxID=1872709 RepID=UPI000E3E3433|nr:nuclear transport factor 2 family protein [Allorhizocola rhizosphaerae]
MEASSGLRELMLAYWEALCTGDVPFVEAHLSTSDVVFAFGTDPAERYEGDSLRQIWRQQLAASGGAVTIVPGDIRAYQEGSVGWIADDPRFRLPDGVEIPVRFTAVAHRRDGVWRFVQAHTSVGVPNERLLGVVLPT